MSQLPWHTTYTMLSKYVVRLSMPTSSGTGFLFHYPQKGLCALATAAHVVEDAHAQGHPIKIDDVSGGGWRLEPSRRAVFLDRPRDAAAVVCSATGNPFPIDVIPLLPEDFVLKVGMKVGWMGFPTFAQDQLCLFTGRVSNYMRRQRAYFVDGVAINGLSGAPVFHRPPAGGLFLVGMVTAYAANRFRKGEALPGLSLVRDLSPLHDMVKHFRNLAQAQAAASGSA